MRSEGNGRENKTQGNWPGPAPPGLGFPLERVSERRLHRLDRLRWIPFFFDISLPGDWLVGTLLVPSSLPFSAFACARGQNKFGPGPQRAASICCTPRSSGGRTLFMFHSPVPFLFRFSRFSSRLASSKKSVGLGGSWVHLQPDEGNAGKRGFWGLPPLLGFLFSRSSSSWCLFSLLSSSSSVPKGSVVQRP